MAQPVSQIVILGGGTAGWMTAAALAHYVSYPGVKITLIESEHIGTVGVGEATIPGIRDFNRRLGIDEQEFMAATQATFKLGIEFHDWGNLGEKYLHPFGFYGHDLNALSFHHYWLRMRDEGNSFPISDYSMACGLAESSKFQLPVQDPRSVLSRYFYAYHLDAGRYANFLRSRAETAGVSRIEGMVDSVSLDSERGDVQELVLKGGQRVQGDLFIDCSGFRALITEGALGTDYLSWSKWLPCDSAIAIASESRPPIAPKTQAVAHKAGWRWRIPLQHRIGNGVVYARDFMSEQQALEHLTQEVADSTLSEPNYLRFQAGMRSSFWVKNCVAIGLSSGFLEPLESTSIHLIQTSIMKLIKLFPDMSFADSKRNEYNRQMTEQFIQVRDFLIAHYSQTQRDDSEFWRYCKNMEIPDSLRTRLEMYSESAQLTDCDHETFVETNWIAILLGQNIFPATYNRRADNIPKAQLANLMTQMRETVQRTCDSLPDHQSFLQNYCLNR